MISDKIASLKNTHLMEWLNQGYGHCQRGSKDWCEGYLRSAKAYIEALEAALSVETAEPVDAKFNFWSAPGEMVFEIPGKIVVSIEPDGIGYTIFRGGRWMSGAHAVETDFDAAGREIASAVGALQVGKEPGSDAREVKP